MSFSQDGPPSVEAEYMVRPVPQAPAPVGGDLVAFRDPEHVAIDVYADRGSQY
jgi:hypothetical protein